MWTSENPSFLGGWVNKGEGRTVTVRYKDLNLDPLEHQWEINPRIYEGIRSVDYSGMTDLVDVMERKLDGESMDT